MEAIFTSYPSCVEVDYRRESTPDPGVWFPPVQVTILCERHPDKARPPIS